MDGNEFIDWMHQEEILTPAKKYYKHFVTVFQKCFNVGKERILLISDFGYPTRRVAPLLTGCYFLAAKELGLDVHVILQEPKRGIDKAEAHVIDSLFKLPEQSVVILNMSSKLGSMDHVGKSFRKFCKDHGHRFISSTTLGSMDTFMVKSMIDAIAIDYDELQKNDTVLKEKIAAGKEMRIQTRAGTDLVIDLKNIDMRSADGNYRDPGKGGNLPAGDVYYAPYNTNGKVVVDACSRNSEGSVLIQKPFTLTIENNKIVKIEGDEEAKLLEKSLQLVEARVKYPERVRHCAEIGIGTNPRAKVIGATILDEKVIGTAHIAIGSNYWFGGTNKTIIHYDQVFKNPKIRIDGKVLKLNGL